LCGREAGPQAVCAPCQADLPRLPPPCCPICALPLGSAAPACGACLARPPAFDATLAAWQYAFPADRLVLLLKYQRRLASADFIAASLLAGAHPAGTLVVPVPLSQQRLRERGFNQALEIARPLARVLDLPLDVGSLVRTRDTAAQSQLPWRARQGNVRHAFACNRDLAGQSVIVVDDVMTTGATLNAVARTLKDHGASRVSNWVAMRAVKTVI
jgi:ComF family protein